MKETFTATTSITINAPAKKVWKGLTDPKMVKQFMFGADLETDWQVGSPIRYTGEYQGKPFEEKGEVKQFEPGKLLQTTNFSSMSGKPDKPENYNLVTYKLAEKEGKTKVTVSQGNIANEKGVAGSKENWKGVLKGLKKVVEGR